MGRHMKVINNIIQKSMDYVKTLEDGREAAVHIEEIVNKRGERKSVNK